MPVAHGGGAAPDHVVRRLDHIGAGVPRSLECGGDGTAWLRPPAGYDPEDLHLVLLRAGRRRVGMSEPGMTRRASPRDAMPPCRHSDQRHRTCSWSPADALDQTEESDGDTARGRRGRGAMVV